MAALALAGITGMYLRQHRQAGVLGLVGYGVFAVGYLTILAVEVIAATVLPALPDTDPGYVQDVLVAATGGTPSGDIGGLQVVLNVSGAGYILGGLLFGIALFRTGILARWAVGPARRQHDRHGGARRAAGLVQPPLRRPRGHRPDRPRRLPVAQPQ